MENCLLFLDFCNFYLIYILSNVINFRTILTLKVSNLHHNWYCSCSGCYITKGPLGNNCIAHKLFSESGPLPHWATLPQKDWCCLRLIWWYWLSGVTPAWIRRCQSKLVYVWLFLIMWFFFCLLYVSCQITPCFPLICNILKASCNGSFTVTFSRYAQYKDGVK